MTWTVIHWKHILILFLKQKLYHSNHLPGILTFPFLVINGMIHKLNQMDHSIVISVYYFREWNKGSYIKHVKNKIKIFLSSSSPFYYKWHDLKTKPNHSITKFRDDGVKLVVTPFPKRVLLCILIHKETSTHIISSGK